MHLKTQWHQNVIFQGVVVKNGLKIDFQIVEKLLGKTLA
tara:strand:+ start:5885 stop:6001 length:117 start_codon:yes stop_codon:yes gene_type:complete